MSQFDSLLKTVNSQAAVLSKSWSTTSNGVKGNANAIIPTLDDAGEEARNQLLIALRDLEQLVLGPRDTLQSFYYRSAETGVIQALCKLKVPHNVPLDGSISYADLSAKVGVSAARLKSLVRVAAICSNFLAESEEGQVSHSANSAIWKVDPMMANGMEVMLDHLPASSFQLGEVCTQDPTDEKGDVCGFNLARNESLYQFFEKNPDQGRKFAAHMRAQAAKFGDIAVQEGYDWHLLKGKTLVDCGGSFGSVATSIIRKEPTIKCVVQDLPKVIKMATAAAAEDPKFLHESISFQPQDFFDPQPVVADVYLFRMVFVNHYDEGVRKILRALQPALRPGARVMVIEYVMPPVGSVPVYAEASTRRLDNLMYALMKGKVRELTDMKELVASVEPNLVFKGCRPGQLRATHDPRCHSVLEWVYEPPQAVNGAKPAPAPAASTLPTREP